MSFFEVFTLAFFVALTGAISPGPLLTYTIYKSIQAKSRAYLIGIFICLGHAILEFGLIIVLLLGLGPLISNKESVIIIGLIGGAILILFGLFLIKDLLTNKIRVKDIIINQENKLTVTNHPIVGGILISMSNPYWWLWWAVIGLNFMTQFSVSLSNLPEFWGFFLGHELGDFAWYGSITIGIGITHNFITDKVYKIIIVCCSIFMIGFGIYLAISPLFM
ncbi:MAG: LysE family transporter [Candidatus Hodarchaeales archaeon]|jgi:threonine/homoserine/homoserine lactone efflux protein